MESPIVSDDEFAPRDHLRREKQARRVGELHHEVFVLGVWQVDNAVMVDQALLVRVAISDDRDLLTRNKNNPDFTFYPFKSCENSK